MHIHILFEQPQAAQAFSMNHTINTIWHRMIRVYKGFFLQDIHEGS